MKCEFVYETDPLDMRLTGGMGGFANTLHCKTHNCSMFTQAASEDMVCYIGRIEALEELAAQLEKRIAQFERPQSNVGPIDELGNPFSLRVPTKSE
jgi:hypothetical protein